MKIIDRLRNVLKGVPSIVGIWNGDQPLFEPMTEHYLKANIQWVATCVELIANVCASSELRLFTKTSGTGKKLNFPSVKLKSYEKKHLLKVDKAWAAGADDIEEILDHPILTLIDYVNENDNKGYLIYYLVSQLLIAGNNFTHKEFKNGLPVALWISNPSKWSIVAGNRNKVLRYEYRHGTKLDKYDPSEIIHFKMPNVGGELLGRSPMFGIIDSINTDHSIRKYEAAYFRNSAMPGGIYKLPEQLSTDEFNAAKNKIQGIYGGAERAGKNLITQGDVDFIPIQQGLKDLAHLKGREVTFQEILGCYHVPEALCKLNRANLASANAALEMFTRLAILPMLRRIEIVLNRNLVPDFDPNLRLIFDNPVPKDRAQEREDRRMQIEFGGRTINELREQDGFEPYADLPEGWGGTFPGLKTANNPFTEIPEEPEEEKRKSEDHKMIREAHWKAFDQNLRVHETIVEKKARELLNGMWAEVLSNIKSVKGVDTWLFDKEEFEEKFKDGLNPPIKSTFMAGAEFQGMIDFDVNSPRAERILSESENRIKNLPTDRWEKMRKSLTEGINNGENIAKLRDRVMEKAKSDDKYGAETIALTETHNAYNGGHFEALMQDDLSEGSEWVTTMDGRERETHAIVDGEKRPKGVAFSNGLMYPGQAGAPAGEVIRCRCTTLVISKGEL